MEVQGSNVPSLITSQDFLNRCLAGCASRFRLLSTFRLVSSTLGHGEVCTCGEARNHVA